MQFPLGSSMELGPLFFMRRPAACVIILMPFTWAMLYAGKDKGLNL